MLYLIGPVVISAVAMRGDTSDKDKNLVEGEDDAYSRWKQTLTSKFLSIFSLAVGFNIFFIVVPIIDQIDLFANQLEYTNALSYASVFGIIDFAYINQVARVVLTIAAAYLTTRATQLFVDVMKFEEGNLFEEGKQTFNNIKSTVREVGDHLSGQYLVDKIDEGIDVVKGLIPGAKIMTDVVPAITQKVGKKIGRIALTAYLTAQGVPPDKARMVADKLEKHKEESKKKKSERTQARAKARAEREEKRN